MAAILVFIAFSAMIVSIVALVRPLPKLWLPTRKRAGYVCGLSFVLMVAAGAFLPEPPPPTPEELAAIAAEEKREAEAAEARRKAEEAEAEAARRVEEREQALAQFQATSDCAKYNYSMATCSRRRRACWTRAREARNVCVIACSDMWLKDSNFDDGACAKPCVDTYEQERDWCTRKFAEKPY